MKTADEISVELNQKGIDPSITPSLVQLIECLNEISAYDPSHLVSRKELGEGGFLQLKFQIENCLDLCRTVAELPLHKLPSAKLHNLLKVKKTIHSEIGAGIPLLELRGILKTMNSMRSSDPNFSNDRQKIITAFPLYFNATYEELHGVVGLLSANKSYISDILEKLRRDVSVRLNETEQVANQIRAVAEQNASEIQHIQKNAQALFEEVKSSSKLFDVAQNATRFDEISDTHSCMSKRWLAASIISTAGFLFALYIFWGDESTKEIVSIAAAHEKIANTIMIKHTLSRLVLASIGFLGVSFTIKNYRAHRHLCVVNAHRANALATFEIFVRAAGSDPKVQNAILLEATHCIFSPAVTGYLNVEEDQPISRITEIMKPMGDR